MGGGLDDFGTFFPVLAALVNRTSGPVLELGCGNYSTPMLHFMCKNRPLFSAETDSKWFEKFAEYQSTNHDIRLVSDWDQYDVIDRYFWDVALVDHAPGKRRIVETARLKDRCRFLVLHDVEELDKSTPCGADYKWAQILPMFKHVWIWNRYRPHTAVVSNFEEFVP
jgi:hypothetical protein